MSLAQYFDEINEENQSVIDDVQRKSSQIITFSHFVPRQCFFNTSVRFISLSFYPLPDGEGGGMNVVTLMQAEGIVDICHFVLACLLACLVTSSCQWTHFVTYQLDRII